MKLDYKCLGLLLTAILLIVASWLGIALARSGLKVQSWQREGIPLLYLAPQQTKRVPGVLVAHGFAGSKQLMLVLAAGTVQQNIGVGKRVLWWLAQSAVLIGGFLLTLNFLPQLGFMFLLLPLFPPLIGILSLVAGLLNRAWVYARCFADTARVGSALFFGELVRREHGLRSIATFWQTGQK